MKTVIVKQIVIILIISIFSSCKKDKCCGKAVTQESLQGKWYIPVDFSFPTEGYVIWDFNFFKDSFQFQITNISDHHIMGTPCESGYWVDYAAGKYSINGNLITMNGFFTDSNYIAKYSVDSTQECFLKKVGDFNSNIDVHFCNDTLFFKQLNGQYSFGGEIKLLKK